MKHFQAYAVIFIVILFGVSCSNKSVAVKKDNQFTNFNGEVQLSNMQEDYSYLEFDSIVNDDIVPEPEIDLYLQYTSINTSNGEYYEEFKEFNVPMAMTSRVSAYINYFTQRVPQITQGWLNRSNKYMNIVQDIFAKEGLPSDLVVLAFTESGFNTHAVSHAGAVGMWQFMGSTGRMYNMEQNFWVDERRDFEKSTHAAAQYLKDLYNRFGDWYLALAAYNAGPGKVARATRKHKTKDFFKISQNRYTLKLETRDYVPKFLAQLIIYKNYLKYNFTPPSDVPLLFAKVKVPTQTNMYWLADKLNIDYKELIELNPALKIGVTPPKEYEIRVPYGKGDEAAKIIADASAEERLMYKIYNAKQGEKLDAIAKKMKVNVNDLKTANGLKYNTVFAPRPIFIPIKNLTTAKINQQFGAMLANLAPVYYKVRRGDTFIAIAHKHNMRMKDLQKLNPNIRASRIFPGQQIVVSEGASTSKRVYSKVAVKKKKSQLVNGKYKVRRGDSLWSIARKFKTSVKTIAAKNNLSTNAIIKPGKVLRIR